MDRLIADAIEAGEWGPPERHDLIALLAEVYAHHGYRMPPNYVIADAIMASDWLCGWRRRGGRSAVAATGSVRLEKWLIDRASMVAAPHE